MKTVKDFIKCKHVEGDIGLEIEVEGNDLPHPEDNKFWRWEMDGSLRGESCEYVLKKPLDLDGVRSALNNLQVLYNKCGSKPTESFRAGVHVHINCQDLTLCELFNFMTLYTIFEGLFIKWCGPNREGNLFCLSSSDADYVLWELKNSLDSAAKNHNVNYFINLIYAEDQIRYLSMNLAALGKYGSLEFRSMRSTPNLDLIFFWVSTLLNLREVAKTYNSPKDIMYEFSLAGAETLINRVLGKDNAVIFKEVSPDWRACLTAGVRNAQEIAFSGDWELINSVEPEGDLPLKRVIPRPRLNQRHAAREALVPEAQVNIPPRIDFAAIQRKHVEAAKRFNDLAREFNLGVENKGI